MDPAAVIIAVATLVTAIGGFIVTLRVNSKATEIKTDVNSRMTAALDRISELERLLRNEKAK